MYLSAELSGVCLWKKVQRKSAYEKTCASIWERAWGKLPLEKCEAQSIWTYISRISRHDKFLRIGGSVVCWIRLTARITGAVRKWHRIICDGISTVFGGHGNQAGRRNKWRHHQIIEADHAVAVSIGAVRDVTFTDRNETDMCMAISHISWRRFRREESSRGEKGEQRHIRSQSRDLLFIWRNICRNIWWNNYTKRRRNLYLHGISSGEYGVGMVRNDSTIITVKKWYICQIRKRPGANSGFLFVGKCREN